jgi:hypothetical protein
MKTNQHTTQPSEAAYSLLTVMIMTGISIGIYAGMAQWTASNSVVNDRNNTYNSALAAAEGASENVLSYLSRDFLNQTFDPNNLSYYSGLVPTNAWAARYRFSDGAGGLNRTHVASTPLLVMTNLNSQFAGLYGMAYNCVVVADATPLGTPYHMTAAVEQDLQLAAIPVFQFAIFYAMDLEVNPGPAMKVTGKVHSNGQLFTAPVTALEYAADVTAVGDIFNNRKPGDPTVAGKVAPVYDAQHIGHVSSLTLPIGTNNSPDAVRAVLQVPPFGENPLSAIGQQRYYNRADLVVTTTATNLVVNAGYWDGFVALAPDVLATTNSPAHYSFITTNASFKDQREGKLTLTTELNVGAFNAWLTNAGSSLNALARYQLGHQLNSVYIVDLRSSSTKLTVVRVANGQQLPPEGLTVVTPQPLYVLGHYNAPNLTPGLTNTAGTLPGSLLGDAITVLSANWTDSNSTNSMTARVAAHTTVNAAFMAGIVETTNTPAGGHYSGGVENFPRFLENWNGKTFTYNGSMVVMFPSQYATSYWVDPGTYYNAPARQWAFDVNFLDYHKLPPVTPMVRKLVRGQWTVVAGN